MTCLLPLGAMCALLGCESRTQLRVVANEVTVDDAGTVVPSFRAGTLSIGVTTYEGDRGVGAQHRFTDPQHTAAQFIFRFSTNSMWPFWVTVGESFAADTMAPNECEYLCSTYMELRPGHSYRIETPILVVPRPCPPPGQQTDEAMSLAEAENVCDKLDHAVTIPNCSFVVTDDNRCSLICPGMPPEDPDPGSPADAVVEAVVASNQTPVTPPNAADASALDAASTDDIAPWDYGPPPEGGEPPM